MNRVLDRVVLLGVLVLLAASVGCTTRFGRYCESRMFDLADTLPTSFASGQGLSVEVHLTRYVGVGAGWADVWRYGFDEGRMGPFWREEVRAVPLISSLRRQYYLEHSDRWPGGQPALRKLDERQKASSYVFIPGQSSNGSLWPPGLSGAEWDFPARSPWSVLDVEVGVVLGWIGVRVGLSPGELVDFLAGIAGFDPAGDDLPYKGPPEPKSGVRVGETEDSSRRIKWKTPDKATPSKEQ
jgi:hypothetical protein